MNEKVRKDGALKGDEFSRKECKLSHSANTVPKDRQLTVEEWVMNTDCRMCKDCGKLIEQLKPFHKRLKEKHEKDMEKDMEDARKQVLEFVIDPANKKISKLKEKFKKSQNIRKGLANEIMDIQDEEISKLKEKLQSRKTIILSQRNEISQLRADLKEGFV